MRVQAAPRRVHPAYALLACLLLAFVISILVRPPHWSSPWLDDGVPDLIQVSAALLCIVRVVAIRQLRSAWAAFALGLLLWSAGDVYWTIRFGGGDGSPGPSLADVGYLAFYPLAYVGLMQVIRSRSRRFPPSLWWDGAVVGLGAAAGAAAFAFDTIARADTGSTFDVIVNIAYPIGDLVLVAATVAMLTLLRGHLEPRWLVLAVGGVLMGLGDILYMFQTAHGAYVEGTIVDATWPAAILLMSYAGWLVPKRTSTIGTDGNLLLAAPLVAATLAGAILVYGNVQHLGPVALGTAAATLAAAGIRMGLGFRDLRRLNETKVLAHTDPLTGLGNRRLFIERLDSALVTASTSTTAYDGRLAVLFIDLDRFKEVNDAFGHSVGDELLAQLGPRLQQILRSSDVLARLGGDEFAVLLAKADSDYALDVAGRVTGALARPFVLQNVNVHIGASVGIALAPEHGRTSEELLRCADVAMYRAKTGHTQFAVYDAIGDTSLDRFRLLEELRDAIDAKALTVYYQPKVDLMTGHVHGVEALVRWPHPTRGLVAPDLFIPLAEDARLMRPLTTLVLEAALAQCAAWVRAGTPTTVAVNLSASNLLDDDLPREVAALLDRNEVPPALLTLEITETTLLVDPDRARDVIVALRRLGVQMSVDDFGTGFSSLAYLRDLPVDELKLDRTFVQALRADAGARDAAIVSSALALGHGLQLRVVAEGVEDEETLRMLAHLGFDAAQGYYLGRAAPAAELDLRPRSVPQPAR